MKETDTSGFEEIEQKVNQDFEKAQSKVEKTKNRYHDEDNRRIVQIGLNVGWEGGFRSYGLLNLRSMREVGLSKRTISRILKKNEEQLGTIQQEAQKPKTKRS